MARVRRTTAPGSRDQIMLDLTHEIIVDLFAGGGGTSTGIEMAIGIPPHIAVNHADHALSMHRMNHPFTRHFIADVFEVCPRTVTRGRPVGALHLSPDCTHHSQAAGGQPRDSRIRALSWVGKRWAGQAMPRVITLENVRQILQWGPLIAKRCKETGRVIKLDGTVAEPGERVPVQQQFLVPDPTRAGETWKRFVRDLEALGYKVEWRILCAADYGAPTTRERLFMIARHDGRPIVWPTKTHAQKPTRGQKPWRAAAECIDWDVPCPSIFDRQKPLAEATLRRIARGVQRYVLQSGDPFIVGLAHGEFRERPGSRTYGIDDPMRTVTAGGGNFALCVPSLVQVSYGERKGQDPRALDIQQPLGTVVAGGIKHALSVAYLMQANGGYNETPGHDMRRPMSTITNTGSHQQLITAHLAHLRGNCDARDVAEPLRTVSAGGEHHGVVECILSPEAEAGALRVAAFLMRYYGEGGQWGDLRDPMATITTRDRLALVTVTIKGTPYVIVDIGLRMLTPRELYRAQGFPEHYIIDRGHDGRKFTKSEQVKMCGNSVSPYVAAALFAANCADLVARMVA